MAENKNQQPDPAQDVAKIDTENAAQIESLKAKLAEAEAKAEKAEARAEKAQKELKTATDKLNDAVNVQERAAVAQLQKQEKVWLTINSNTNDSSHVMVAVNGHAFRIKRDVPVLVPKAVAEVLKLAAYDKPVTEKLPNGQTRTSFKHVKRYSFTVETAAKDAKQEDA